MVNYTFKIPLKTQVQSNFWICTILNEKLLNCCGVICTVFFPFFLLFIIDQKSLIPVIYAVVNTWQN